MTVLLTGFGPFVDVVSNPSQIIVEALAQHRPELVTEILPVEYMAAGQRMQRLIHEVNPSVVFSLGLANNRAAINLERVALNLNDSPTPDNVGDVVLGRTIMPDAPLALRSTLPLRKMAAALHEHQIPVEISNHAGTYVCNHVFFLARYTLERLRRGTPCGFIHLPAETALSLEVMYDAVSLCLDTLVQPLGE